MFAKHPIDSFSLLTGDLESGGRLLILAPCGLVEINSVDLVTKAAGVMEFRSEHALDSEEAIAFTQLRNIDYTVEKFPLRDVQKAFDYMLSGEVRSTSVLVME